MKINTQHRDLGGGLRARTAGGVAGPSRSPFWRTGTPEECRACKGLGSLSLKINTQHTPLTSMRRSYKKSCAQIRRLLSDKATEPDGISNRMLWSQLGGDRFILLLFFHLSNIWRESIYPDQWASSLMQPLYKGDGKDREDPASYRGIFL